MGNVIEYSGDGVRSLSIPQRATITNMGAELGATTSIFPSDEVTREFLKKQHREDAYEELKADEDAVYDTVIDIDLNTLEPMIAMPHSPDNVLPISEVLGLKVDQVAIGSCTNSSYMDMMSVAGILKNKTVDQSGYFSGLPTGTAYDFAKRWSLRYDFRRCQNTRIHLWSLYRHGTVTDYQCTFPAYL